MKIDANQFNEAIESIEGAKGISRETVIEALKEAMMRAYRKELGGDDADVRVTLDLEKGIVDMCHVLKVVKEVEDDFLEISVEDANEKDPSKEYKDGDEFIEKASLDTLRNATLMSIKSIIKQKFAEAERGILYEAFKDKIGTMITGKVETIDDHGASVNIGRTSVFLPRKEMIGDEHFLPGENIKLFVSNVGSGTKGAHIEVSRANEGCLKAIFTEEISEIYSGAIVIKAAARQAGERSKIAVWANDPNVDPAGACIGPNGNRVQKIVSQLGNGSTKEKVDVIAYNDNAKLFIAEALKPARLAGLDVDEENKFATIVVKDDSLSLAIGKKGVNVRLAAKLTGFKLDVMTESDALDDGIEFTPISELEALATALKAERVSQAQKASVEVNNDILPGLPEGYVAPQQRVYEKETNDFDVALEEQSENEELNTINQVKPTDVETVAVKPVETVNTSVKTTTSLSDLEASLEAEANKNNNKNNFSKKKRFNKENEEKEEEKVAPTVKKTDPSNNMSIYTEEELKEFEEADKELDEDYEEEEVDYDEYDDYYDEEK